MWLVGLSVHLLIVNSSHIKGRGSSQTASLHRSLERCRDIWNAATVRISPTTVHKYEHRGTRGMVSHTPSEQGFKLQWSLPITKSLGSN
ncbi:hypothetical protein AVEN_154725-1 [Araneus ventricosus]|uniref:Secreted protein n=1 Tax=Araneus ventricosus TaxID=182803 RepID=A0A4Y2VF26_ARAVE|nr:hypothetical protein AVEN_154725-1 [Araneus ventricosus]